MKNSNKTNPNPNNTDIADVAINQKSNEADGAEINHQVKQRKEQHQPRDNA